jgi:ABC-type antimicrobial peptide transport system permease subunit
VRLRWIVVISLLVTVIGIANSMLMSVTERFRDIGTMKCLGALSSLVRTLFLLEAAFMGTVGGVAGVAGGALFAFASYLLPYGGSLVLGAFAQGAASLAVKALLSLVAGIVLSIVAALYPAAVAARMVPADALRSSV